MSGSKPFHAAVLLLALSAAALGQSFSITQRLATGPAPSGVKNADVNKDGRLDLLWISGEHNIEIRRGTSIGTFLTSGPVFDTGIRSAANPGTAEFEVQDVNGDGKPDIVAAGGQAISVMLGNGDGTFRSPKLFGGQSSEPEDAFNSLALADFNRDGRLDAVVSNDVGIQIFFGRGDGTFSSPKIFGGGLSNAHSVEAGDFNGDGNADVAFWQQCDPTSCDPIQLIALFGDGNGSFNASNFIQSGLPSMNLFVRDINGDRRSDIVGVTQCFESGCTARVYTWINIGGIFFTIGSSVDTTPYDYLTGLGFVDYNLDGITDLAVGGIDTREKSAMDAVVFIRRRSDNSLSLAGTFPVGAYNTRWPSAVTSGDFNRDGKTDLAVSLQNSDQILVMRNAAVSPPCSLGALYTMHICEPANNATVSSPVHVRARANSDRPISAWKIYVDGVVKKFGSGGTIDTFMTLGSFSFKRRITVKAWDSSGREIASTVYITVR